VCLIGVREFGGGGGEFALEVQQDVSWARAVDGLLIKQNAARSPNKHVYMEQHRTTDQ
jgi:hypothetical protein